MYQKIYIPESQKVENMSLEELHFYNHYYYNHPPQTPQEQKEERCIWEKLAYIQDQSHT